MLSTTKELEITYEKRIEALRTTKIEHNDIKLKLHGYHDVDDHGLIPWPDPIPWEPKPNHPSGGVFGPKAIGENFRAWLDVHPVYIHPLSAVAGAWAGSIRVGGWKPEDKPTELYPLHKEYNDIFVGIEAMNHLSGDLKIGLDLGWGGLLKKIRYYRNFNHPPDTGFYDGEESLVLGIQDWIRRHVVKAREMAAEQCSPETRDNLLAIADMNEWLADNPPRTLREAVQFLTWFQSVDRMYCTGGAMGQLDELLRPYYEADKAAGLLPDDEEVVWYIASLLFNDTHYSQIGGPTPDGHDLTSRMSFLVLEATHQLHIPANIALRVHDQLDPELLHLSVKYLFEDGTGVCYSLSGGLDKGYARNGVPIQLARMRAKVGCNWTALPGIEYPLQDVNRLCMVSPFLHAFNEIIADPQTPHTMDELWKRYTHHLAINVDIFKQGFAYHMERHAANSPEIVLNLFCHGPLERGLDVAAGGVDIYFLTLDGVGMPTVADSFAAIEQRVVEEKRLTWEELAGHLADDYAGAENVRLMLKNIPRYGTGGSRADWWAKRISETYSDLVRRTPTSNGFDVIPGLFSHSCVDVEGRHLPATPNGRHAFAPIAHSSNPDPGFARGGASAPTAKAMAVAATQPGWGNSAPLQMELDSHLVRELGGLEAVESLIKVHNDQGGTLININVISREQILAAHANPDLYPDLVVRVSGYSAFFKSLSPELRQIVVDRMLTEA
jgi:formate C-acetyltransferase